MNERADILRIAVEEVRSVGLDPDSAGGAVALRHLLGEQNERVRGAPSGSANPEAGAGTEPAANVAAWAATTVERLSDLVEFDKDGATVRISAARLPRSKADRQRVLAMLKLSVDRVGCDRESTDARAVNALCDEYSCADQNLPHNVTSWGDFISRRGARGRYAYRLSQPGLERAQQLWHELAEGTEALRP